MDQTNIGFFNFAEQGFSLPIENYDSDSYSSIDQVFLSYPPASEASRKVANLLSCSSFLVPLYTASFTGFMFVGVVKVHVGWFAESHVCHATFQQLNMNMRRLKKSTK